MHIYIYITHCISTLIWTRTHRLSHIIFSSHGAQPSSQLPPPCRGWLRSPPVPFPQLGVSQERCRRLFGTRQPGPGSLPDVSHVLWRWVTVKANQKKWLKFWCSLLKSVQIFISSTNRVNSGDFSQIMAAMSGTVTVAWNPGHLKHCQATITKQTAPSVTLPHNPDALCGYTGGKMVI